VDAIVLAGGAGSRLGGTHKPDQLVGSATLLEHVVAAVHGSGTVVVVGPERANIPGVTWCREQPPGGGPVAAIAAGLSHTQADDVLVLAADLPWVAGAIDPLLAALAGAQCAVLVDSAGRRNPLASAWRRPALVRALDRVSPHSGARASALLDGTTIAEVADAGGWGEDCDTPDDLARARRREHRLHGRAP
jgi:molybdopterin-guanine dinucleotide biosynthesis protein A